MATPALGFCERFRVSRLLWLPTQVPALPGFQPDGDREGSGHLTDADAQALSTALVPANTAPAAVSWMQWGSRPRWGPRCVVRGCSKPALPWPPERDSPMPRRPAWLLPRGASSSVP